MEQLRLIHELQSRSVDHGLHLGQRGDWEDHDGSGMESQNLPPIQRGYNNSTAVSQMHSPSRYLMPAKKSFLAESSPQLSSGRLTNGEIKRAKFLKQQYHLDKTPNYCSYKDQVFAQNELDGHVLEPAPIRQERATSRQRIRNMKNLMSMKEAPRQVRYRDPRVKDLTGVDYSRAHGGYNQYLAFDDKF